MRSATLMAAEPEPVASVRRGSIARLDLSAFRNYAILRHEFEPSPVVLVGPNGAGKTNLLEALSFLVPGRGLRRSPLAEICRRSPTGDTPAAWAVSAQIRIDGDTVTVGTGYDPAAGVARRAVRIDREPATAASLAEHVTAVWLTPEMDRLFQDSGSARRQFVDRLVFGFDPTHAKRIAGYDQSRRERLHLLAQGERDTAWLGAIEERLAELGIAIAAARRDALARLDRVLREQAGEFPRLSIGLAGEVDAWLDDGPALVAEDQLRSALAASRRADAESGRMQTGPHRSDLVAIHLGHGHPVGQCSTGEQKAALTAVILAHAELLARTMGHTPLLLLDEITAHLDSAHRAELFARVTDMGVQAWMTGTEVGIFRELRGRARFLTVVNATIT